MEQGDPEDCDDTLGYIATLYLHYIILHFTPAESSWAKLLITRAIRQRDKGISESSAACHHHNICILLYIFGHFTQTLAQYYFLNIFLEKKEPHSVFRGSRPPNPGGHIILPQKRPCVSYRRCC